MFIKKQENGKTISEYCIRNVDDIEEMAGMLFKQAEFPKTVTATIWGNKHAVMMRCNDDKRTVFEVSR